MGYFLQPIKPKLKAHTGFLNIVCVQNNGLKPNAISPPMLKNTLTSNK